jgi:hypothetical protein
MLLLRTMQDLRKERDSIADHAAAEGDVQALRDARSSLSEKLKATVAAMRELKDAERRMGIVVRASAADPRLLVDVSDVRTVDIPVPGDCIARLIGKQGKGLHECEAATNTAIDVIDATPPPPHHHSHSHSHAAAAAHAAHPFLRVTGLPAGLGKVEAWVAALAAQIDVTLPVSALLGAFLLLNKGACVQELQTRLDVRIRIDRGATDGIPHAVTVHGLAPAIAELKAIFDDAERGKFVREFDSRLTPTIIGKSGANLKRLRAETGCEVFVSRAGPPGVLPAGAPIPPTVVSILSVGPSAAADVARAVAMLLSVLDGLRAVGLEENARALALESAIASGL